MTEDPLFCLLHHAVIDNDIPTVQDLSHDPLLRHIRNAAGFTPLQLAQLLGHRACLSLLAPPKRRCIHAYLQGSSSLTKLTEAEFQERFHVSYTSHSFFSSYPALLKCQANCPLMISKTFLGLDNRELAKQFQYELEEGFIAPVSIRWIDDVLGYGVFADVDIPQGAFIGEFTGLVKEMSRKHPETNEYCFHFPTRFFSWNYYIVDAKEHGNEMRFVNHSDLPNLVPHHLIVQSLSHIVFIAKQNVKANTQLTYNYGKDFFRYREKVPN